MIFIGILAILVCIFFFLTDIQYFFMAKHAMKEWRKQAEASYQKFPNHQKEIKFCYYILQKTSRSFSSVIMQLSDELRDVICVFYLCCRALDTIEDTPNQDEKQKIHQLTKFVDLYLKEKRSIPVPEACKPEYYELCKNFP